MPPQRPTMSASVQGFGEECFDRNTPKTSRQNAPSFSNGLLRANKLVNVVFPHHNSKAIICHADILRFWSPKLRALLDTSDAAVEEMKQKAIREGTYPKIAVDGSMKDFSLGTIRLLDVHPQTFTIFLDWAYSEKLPATKPLLTTPAPADTEDSESNASFYFRQPEAKFLEAYIFGRRYHIREFRNNVFDCLYEIVNWRKVGKEGDPTGSLMPSLIVCQRAFEALAPYTDDPAADFLWGLFSQNLPNAIQTTREEHCATQLEEDWDTKIRDEGKGDEVRSGPYFRIDVKDEQDKYCERYHKHMGPEGTECWALPKPANDVSKGQDDAGSAMDEGDDEMTVDGVPDGTDEDDAEKSIDGEDQDNKDVKIEDEADVSMDEDGGVEEDNKSEVVKNEEQADVSMDDESEGERSLPEVKSFSIWGSDESASEAWDDDYEYRNPHYDSDEFKEEEEKGEVTAEAQSMWQELEDHRRLEVSREVSESEEEDGKEADEEEADEEDEYGGDDEGDSGLESSEMMSAKQQDEDHARPGNNPAVFEAERYQDAW